MFNKIDLIFLLYTIIHGTMQVRNDVIITINHIINSSNTNSNCPITWLLKNSGGTIYSGTFLTHTNGAISYDPDTAASETVYLTITAGQFT